ncbi:MAG: hypothetical protein WDM89_22085 [Rhizomicrobium sp.]
MADIIFPGSPDLYYSIGERWQTAAGYLLMFTRSGDLQLLDLKSKQIWSSNTAGAGGIKLRVQEDGNVVIYDAADGPVWASDTNGNPGAYLSLQEEGRLVVYSKDHHPLWRSDAPNIRSNWVQEGTTRAPAAQ